MRTPRAAVVVVAVIAGATFATGLSAAATAGASRTNTTYYGCVSAAGALSKVGNNAPTCPSGSRRISWNSAGPAGPQGPAGAAVNTCSSPPGPRLNFSTCTLSSVSWPFVDLTGTLLISAALTNAYLYYTDLAGGNLTNADAYGSDLAYANLNGANLTRTILDHGDLAYADMSSATMSKIDLLDADLKGANLTGASLIGVKWSNTTCPDGTNSDNDGGTCAAHL